MTGPWVQCIIGRKREISTDNRGRTILDFARYDGMMFVSSQAPTATEYGVLVDISGSCRRDDMSEVRAPAGDFPLFVC